MQNVTSRDNVLVELQSRRRETLDISKHDFGLSWLGSFHRSRQGDASSSRATTGMPQEIASVISLATQEEAVQGTSKVEIVHW